MNEAPRFPVYVDGRIAADNTPTWLKLQANKPKEGDPRPQTEPKDDKIGRP